MASCASLTPKEKEVVKALLKKGWKNQDIHALVNIGREKTINFARIAEVKSNENIRSSSDNEVKEYIKIQNSWDLKRKINPYVHERIYKSIEAMATAVNIFNNPIIRFKTELFCVLSVISWTYLLQEYYIRKKESIKGGDGKFFSLKKLINKHSCPLNSAEKENIKNIIKIRDSVEHKLFADADKLWTPLFQANCLNYNKFIKTKFWEELSIDNLGYAIQFSNISNSQIKNLQNHIIPEEILTIDKNMLEAAENAKLSEYPEYRMKLIVTYQSAGPCDSSVKFISPETETGKEISNILVRQVISDEKYPYRPKDVCKIVSEKIGKGFNMSDHIKAWKRHGVRPETSSKNPENTNKNYCIYHKVHKDYTYNDEWIKLLISENG